MSTDSLTLPPIRRISGEVTLPGSKSLSHRMLLLAALAREQGRRTPGKRRELEGWVTPVRPSGLIGNQTPAQVFRSNSKSRAS